jgi:hypothetical protein
MAQRTFCNGCGREVSDGPENRHDDELQTQRFHVVEVRRAQIAGAGQPLGLAGEPFVRGEVCDGCWADLVAFVGPKSDEEAQAAHASIRGGGRALAQV